MTLSSIDAAINSLENMIGGLEKEISQSYENVGLSLPSGKGDSTEPDQASRIEGQRNRIIVQVNRIEWLMHMVTGCNNVVDSQEIANVVKVSNLSA